ncbi:MAG: 4-(cytidine 5'-diphospho)-2-C-methyl-D-erythritol kinase [Candidatus Omnitrophica bacterium]|nr:4-(cytidine 5'-diphospho)-2-C-methyl-D-erythritol kinase [Candidatus Omnitrophota bacterium]
MKKIVIKSYAKLNLYLEVLNQRKDGYHNIYTLFERIDLADTITLRCLPGKTIKINSNSQEIPHNQDNLAYKAALILQKSLHRKKGVEIFIKKQIPVGSGMGGGSSNAASTLLGLNKLWHLNLSRPQLVNFAQKLGSDVPFFVYDCPFALGQGRGEMVKPLKSLNSLKLWHLVAVPRIFVSTAKIYAGWDKAKKGPILRLTSAKSNVKILILNLKKRDLLGVAHYLFNSLEKVTTRFYPGLVQAKRNLQNTGLQAAMMSGSGSAVFALCVSRKEALKARAKLQDRDQTLYFLTKTK